ncbi:unnamed protein product [Nezara viridula]|uniref:Uncharacterized protein n=1 Tax=Nezara viridula TaxID=85310 RepID=A0A9P0HIC0_NEZVI|nr:unnamed protein product [Nezara viridula]
MKVVNSTEKRHEDIRLRKLRKVFRSLRSQSETGQVKHRLFVTPRTAPSNDDGCPDILKKKVEPASKSHDPPFTFKSAFFHLERSQYSPLPPKAPAASESLNPHGIDAEDGNWQPLGRRKKFSWRELNPAGSLRDPAAALDIATGNCFRGIQSPAVFLYLRYAHKRYLGMRLLTTTDRGRALPIVPIPNLTICHHGYKPITHAWTSRSRKDAVINPGTPIFPSRVSH